MCNNNFIFYYLAILVKYVDLSYGFDKLKAISKRLTIAKISIIVYAITFKDVTELSIRYFECLNYGD